MAGGSFSRAAVISVGAAPSSPPASASDPDETAIGPGGGTGRSGAGSSGHRDGVMVASRPSATGAAGSAGSSSTQPGSSMSSAGPASSSRNSRQRPSSSAWVPTSTTRPPSSTAIRSASESVERRWAITSVVRCAVTALQGLADRGLGGGVDGGRGVVEHEDPGVVEQRAGERHALALAARERQAPLADAGVVALGQVVDEPVGLRGGRGGADLLLGGVRAAVGDVGPHGVGEEERLLEHHADRAAQGVEAQLAHVDGLARRADAQRAALHVVEARGEQRDRRLARARGADERHRLAGRDLERQPVEHGLAARVAEPDVVELDAERPRRDLAGRRRVDDLGLGVDELVDPLHARAGELPGDDEPGDEPRGPHERRDVGGERDEHPERDLPADRERPAETEHPELAQRRQRLRASG